MIYIFDLDDTLYEERQYVLSGFEAVAEYTAMRWGLDPQESYRKLIQLLAKNGRGRLFDDLLAMHQLNTKKNVSACITTYRQHKPNISMPSAHRQLLEQLPKPLYLVTDGNKMVQQNKVTALGIEHYFKRVLITHRFGIKHAKPSTYCFELIKKAEGCEWQDMLYIGDNPAKDFVNIKKLGMHTVRVLTGEHKDKNYGSAFDARTVIKSLNLLKAPD